MALSPELYARLKAKFGDVEIVRRNEEYRPNWVTDHITGRRVRGIGTVSGEAYRLSCPFCGDQKQRLYVNHKWMQWDQDAFRTADDMIRCFNETNCFADPETRSKFHAMLFGGTEWVAPVGLEAEVAKEADPRLLVPEPPGTVVKLTDMAPNQPCVSYLTGRGYSVEYLTNWWNVGYVTSVGWGHHVDCLNRIYVPMSYNGLLVGYQCRYIGDRQWTKDCPKYRTMRRMARGRYLYNYDVAKRSRVVVLVEGPTSAWAVGPRSVALWGKSMSLDQMSLIRSTWLDDCLVVVLMDGAAVSEANKIRSQLLANCYCRVVLTQLQFQDDPGKLGEAVSWALIDKSCQEAGVNLSSYLEGENPSATAVSS